jgi:hypothetical protein
MHVSRIFLALRVAAVVGAALVASACSYPTRVFVPEDGSSDESQASSGASVDEASSDDSSTPDALGSADATADVTTPADVTAPPSGPCSATSSAKQVFTTNIFGCQDVQRAVAALGGTTWADRATLCGSSCRVCTAQDWVAYRSGSASTTPAANFWIDDDLASSAGSVPLSCGVESDAGATVGDCADSPMHVCLDGFTSSPVKDSTGDTCSLHDCGFDSTRPNLNFGGCGMDPSDRFAGTLCCCP